MEYVHSCTFTSLLYKTMNLPTSFNLVKLCLSRFIFLFLLIKFLFARKSMTSLIMLFSQNYRQGSKSFHDIRLRYSFKVVVFFDWVIFFLFVLNLKKVMGIFVPLIHAMNDVTMELSYEYVSVIIKCSSPSFSQIYDVFEFF